MLPLNNNNGALSKPDLHVFELARMLCANQDVDSLLGHISSAVERMTHSSAASILLLDAEKKQLVFRVATGEKGSAMKKFYVPLGKGIAGWVAQNKQPVIINDVLNDQRFSGQIDKSSGFSTKSILAIPLMVNDEVIGVCEALNKIEGDYTTEDQHVLESLSALAAATIHNARVAEDNRNFFTHSIEIIAMAVEGCDSRSTGHSYRVAELACRIGRHMGLEGEDYRALYYAAILHDIGMVAVHNLKYLPNVLSQTIERTPEKLHPLLGAELVKDIKLLSKTGPIIRHHHEYIDGSGHPDGLVGADIPLASRIIGLCEHLDELIMQGYAGDELIEKAKALAIEGAGTKFDKDVVDAYLALG